MKSYKFYVLLTFIVFVSGCATKPSTLISNITDGIKKAQLKNLDETNREIDKSFIYRVDYPNQRAENRGLFFDHEFELIKVKRAFYGFDYDDMNKKIVGLGLSGGGIRANAFGLGILSGLNSSKYKDSTLLKRLDYISSVSGGSWANGSYFAQKLDDEKFFQCLDTTAEDTRTIFCDKYAKVLRHEQFQALTREFWEEAIFENSLLKTNINFATDDIETHLLKKPYPIINITHSAVFMEQSTEHNFPFEVTPHFCGTIVDCGSGEQFCSMIRRNAVAFMYDKNIAGFFVNHKAQNINILQQIYFGKEDVDGNYFSKYLHASSAVVGKMLSLTYLIKYKDSYIENLREVYVLSDGGKSDNIGITPLIERGANLIIISQISADPAVEFEDLTIASKQVKKLLKRDIKTKKITKKGKNVSLMTKTEYSFHNQKEGDIIFVKPTLDNIKEFLVYLKRQRDENGKLLYPHIIKELEEDSKPTNMQYVKEYLKNVTESTDENKKYEENQKKFPQTPTFLPQYPKNLIYAYYLLGKFIAQNHLSKEVIDWLEKN